MHCPITAPVATLSAANWDVVPWRRPPRLRHGAALRLPANTNTPASRSISTGGMVSPLGTVGDERDAGLGAALPTRLRRAELPNRVIHPRKFLDLSLTFLSLTCYGAPIVRGSGGLEGTGFELSVPLLRGQSSRDNHRSYLNEFEFGCDFLHDLRRCGNKTGNSRRWQAAIAAR